MAELRPRIPELREAGGDLAIVGSGGPSFADGFRELLALGDDVPVLSDEERRSYALLGFKRGLSTFGFRSIAPYVRAWLHGQHQGRQQGDALQQGGAIVVRPDGTIAFHYASRFAGDHPKADAIVEAVRRAASSASAASP